MPKIALVQDYLAQVGGAEKVYESLHNILPEADLCSTLAVREKLTNGLRQARIRTTWMQNLPSPERYFRHYFLLFPFAIESLDLTEYELILSSCCGYAKGVRKHPDAVHVSYCHTPMRWVWRYEDYAAREQFGRLKQMVLPPLLAGLKQWDLRASRNPDYFIANSNIVAQRIKEFYRRDAVVIAPPINVNRFKPSVQQQDYYVVLSRLVGYKRIDLAIDACNRLKRKLVVIGDGPDRKRLEQMAGPTVTLLGRQPDEVVEGLVSQCRSLLFPGEEDFGMVPLEVNAAGRPVIAYRGGGALETVIEGETGIFFDQPTTTSLAEAILEFERYSWNPARLRQHAERFSEEVFRTRILDFLKSVVPDAVSRKVDNVHPSPGLSSLVTQAS